MKDSKTLTKILILCVVILAFALTTCIVLLAGGKKDKPKDTQKVENTQEETNTPAAEDTDAQSSQAVEFTDVEDMVFIVVNDANVREEPSVESEVVLSPPLGKMYRRTGSSEEWSRIEEETLVYYVHNDYISDTPPQGLEDNDLEGLVDEPDILPGSDSATEEGNGKIVVIDPGHQAQGDNGQEPIGPGASSTKARVSSGTTGVATGWAEYELNLEVSLRLRDELVERGYTVYMTRESHDVNMSNKERAEFAASKEADILVRIHANGSDDSSVSGALCMAPSSSNSFLPPNLIADSQRLSKSIIDEYIAATGFNDQGVYMTDEMSGINWSTMPVTIVEMGYMTNSQEDENMADQAVQAQIVQGIAQGIDLYFD